MATTFTGSFSLQPPFPASLDVEPVPVLDEKEGAKLQQEFTWSPTPGPSKSGSSSFTATSRNVFLWGSEGGGGGRRQMRRKLDTRRRCFDVEIFPEDIFSLARSCLDPNQLIMAFNALHNDRRLHFEARLGPSTSSNVDELESELQRWIAPRQPPHRPLQNHARRVLVLLNPFSGQRHAEKLWIREVEPILARAGFQMEVVLTQAVGHATEMAQRVELDRVGLLALGGGDGLVSEVLQGLLSHSDNRRALRLPLLHLPMGTGNALAASICFQANEPFSARGSFCEQLALMAIRPVYRRLRLYRVQFSWGLERHMFLSLSWGLMADIDIGSERFRWLGMARLHLEAFIRVARLPSVARYRAKLYFLPIAEGTPIGFDLAQFERKLRYQVDMPREQFGPGHFEGGEVEEEDEEGDEEEIHMPPLNEPLPASWKSVEGEFCFVTVAGLSHLGSDLPYLPSARLHERCMFLTFVQYPKLTSRMHMAQILLSIDTSAHLANSTLEIVPCLACRIEPAPGAGGMLALDGEAVPQRGESEAVPMPTAFQVASTRLCATVVGRSEKRRSTVKDFVEEEVETTTKTAK